MRFFFCKIALLWVAGGGIQCKKTRLGFIKKTDFLILTKILLNFWLWVLYSLAQTQIFDGSSTHRWVNNTHNFQIEGVHEKCTPKKWRKKLSSNWMMGRPVEGNMTLMDWWIDGFMSSRCNSILEVSKNDIFYWCIWMCLERAKKLMCVHHSRKNWEQSDNKFWKYWKIESVSFFFLDLTGIPKENTPQMTVMFKDHWRERTQIKTPSSSGLKVCYGKVKTCGVDFLRVFVVQCIASQGRVFLGFMKPSVKCLTIDKTFCFPFLRVFVPIHSSKTGTLCSHVSDKVGWFLLLK